MTQPVDVGSSPANGSFGGPWIRLWGLAGLYLLVGFFLPLGAHVHADGEVAPLGPWEFFRSEGANFVSWMFQAFLAYSPIAGLAALLTVAFVNARNRSIPLVIIGLLGYMTSAIAGLAAAKDPHIDPVGLIRWTPFNLPILGFACLLLIVGALFAVSHVYPDDEARTSVRLLSVTPAIAMVACGAMVFAISHGPVGPSHESHDRDHPATERGSHGQVDADDHDSDLQSDGTSAHKILATIERAITYPLVVAPMLLAGFCLLGSIPGRVFLRIRRMTARLAWLLLWTYFACAALTVARSLVANEADHGTWAQRPAVAALWIFGGANFWLTRYAYLFLATTGASEALRIHAGWRRNEDTSGDGL